MAKRITKEQVMVIFEKIVRNGKIPTASKIEKALHIDYKSTTVHKILQDLKLKAFQCFIEEGKQTIEDNSVSKLSIRIRALSTKHNHFENLLQEIKDERGLIEALQDDIQEINKANYLQEKLNYLKEELKSLKEELKTPITG